jgi:predicted nucleic acid-binding Zn ribbon protein
MQSMSDDALTTCAPEFCVSDNGHEKGAGVVTRVLFAPAIHFKGTGFHNTDYGSKRRGGGDDSGGSGSGDGSSNGSSGGETKAAEAPPKTGSGTSSGKTVGLDKV